MYTYVPIAATGAEIHKQTKLLADKLSAHIPSYILRHVLLLLLRKKAKVYSIRKNAPTGTAAAGIENSNFFSKERPSLYK